MFTPLRSREWINGTDEGGETFVLFAFVTDVAEDVMEGMDRIPEHMSDFCIS